MIVLVIQFFLFSENTPCQSSNFLLQETFALPVRTNVWPHPLFFRFLPGVKQHCSYCLLFASFFRGQQLHGQGALIHMWSASDSGECASSVLVQTGCALWCLCPSCLTSVLLSFSVLSRTKEIIPGTLWSYLLWRATKEDWGLWVLLLFASF